MTRAIGFAVLLFSFAGVVQAADMQSSGQCTIERDSSFLAGDSVEWNYDPGSGLRTATLRALSQRIDGEVIAVRPHDDGVKVNMRFSGGTYFATMDVVAMKNANVSSFAMIGTKMHNGQELISFVSGFRDAECDVR